MEKFDPYFERTSHLYGIINGIQNTSLELIKDGFKDYTIDDLFFNRSGITERFYFALLKQKLEIKDKK